MEYWLNYDKLIQWIYIIQLSKYEPALFVLMSNDLRVCTASLEGRDR